MIYLVFIAAVLALGFAAFNFVTVKRMPEGTKQMQEISGAIVWAPMHLSTMSIGFYIQWWRQWLY